MKNINSFFLSLVFWTSTSMPLYAQKNAQKGGMLNPFLASGYTHMKFKDHMKHKLLEKAIDTIHIFNQSHSVPLRGRFTKDAVNFENDSIKIVLKKEKKKFSQIENVVIDTLEAMSTLLIRSVEGKFPYGLNIPEDTIETFSELKYFVSGKEVNIPDSCFQNLFFPNFIKKVGPIKPVRAYMKNEFVYICIFGYNYQGGSFSDIRSYDTYMAKIILDKHGFVALITASLGELTAYNWDCKGFIDF